MCITIQIHQDVSQTQTSQLQKLGLCLLRQSNIKKVLTTWIIFEILHAFNQEQTNQIIQCQTTAQTM